MSTGTTRRRRIVRTRRRVVTAAPSMLALALALCAGPALAQDAALPGVRVGDRWAFVEYYAVPSTVPNRHWVITSVSPAGIEGTENGEPLRLTLELNVLDSPRATFSNPRALAFPLRVGKRWRYESDWTFKPKASRGRTVVDVAVAGREQVSVPAGTFDAYKLVAKGSLHGTSPINSQYAGETMETYWYAPAARAIVKSVRHNPYLGTSTVELLEYRLQPR